MWRSILAGSLAATGSVALADVVSQPQANPGIYSNEEQVYFAKEAGSALVPPLVFLKIDDTPGMTMLDAFGQPRTGVDPTIAIIAADAMRLNARLPDHSLIELRRARGFTCWGAALKTAKKPDGSDDWFGASKLKLHDQGGRVRFGGGDSGAPETILRMRNVIWPSGPNRPSLVLYVHTPHAPDRAVSYSWADTDAKTVGINLRWMQASCTLDAIP